MAADVTVSLSASSRRMADASPVFIVGHTRSGTSLLYRVLQSHPAFRPTRLDLHETQIFAHLPMAFRFDAHPPRQLVAFMLKDHERFNAFLAETRSVRRASALAAPVSLALRGRVPLAAWRAQGLHLVVRSYLSHAWAARGCERLVEKSPRNVPHIPKLRLVSPRSRQLFISRHPVDVYSSYQKRAQTDRTATWANISPHHFVRRYRRAARGAISAAATDDSSLLLVRYEDLTSNAEAEFQRICDFLGEPFDRSAIEEQVPAGSQQSQRDLPVYGAIIEHTKRWEDHVAVEEARLLETELADVMEWMRFPRYT